MEQSGILKRKAIIGMIWSFSSLILNQGIQFIVQIILARLLLPKDFGIVGLLTVFIAISQIFIDAGFTNALIREKDPSNEDYSTVFYFNLGMAVTIYCIIFIMAPFAGRFYNEPQLTAVLRVMSFVLIISSFGIIQRTMLTKKIDFKKQTKIDIFASIISGVVAIVFALKGAGVWSLVVKTLAMQAIQSICLCWINRWKPLLCFKMSSFKKFFNFGWKLLCSGILDTLYNNLYLLIIGKAYSTVELGYYTNAQKLRDAVSQSTSLSVQKVGYSVLSTIKSNDDKLKAGYRKIIKASVFVTFPVIIVLIVIARPLITLIFSTKWTNSIWFFQVLCLAGMLYPLHALNLDILQVKGRSDLFLKLEIIKKILGMIIIISILYFNLGIRILVWGLVVISVMSYFINSFYSGKLLDYSTYDQLKDIAPVICSSAITAIITEAVAYLLPDIYIVQIFVGLTIGIISYLTICRILKVQEIKLIINLFRKLRSVCSDKLSLHKYYNRDI